MGNGIIGKVLYFWIFIIGGLFFAKIFGFIEDSRTTITLLIAMALVYIVFQLFKYLGREKREERKAAQTKAVPVHKGNKKRKKR